MPVGYLVMLSLIVACTVVALAPRPRGRRSRVAAFAITCAVNELPHAALAALVAASALAVWQDDLLATGAGRAAASVAVVTAAGLVVIAARAWPTSSVMNQSLASGLPAGSRGAVGAATSHDRPSPARLLRTLVAPLPVRPRGVERVADLSYGSGGRRHRLDVYRRTSGSSDAPVLVYFHGGGYTSGDKHRESRALLHRLAASGWVCVSANYRLRPGAGLVEHLTDATRVLAWVRAHGRDHGADVDTVVVCGSSAGAHLAALVALAADHHLLQPGREDPRPAVAAAICLYGYYGKYYGDTVASSPPTSPMSYAPRDAPPFLVVHGSKDSYVPVEGARGFVEHLGASRSPVVYCELPGAQHAFDLFRSVRSEAVVDGVEHFLQWLLRTRPAAGRAL